MLFVFVVDLLCTIVVAGMAVIGVFLLIAYTILTVGEKHNWW